jgi:hypothetical protein
MAITTQTGKVVVDTNLVPYIRGREIEFVANNLKPYKISRIFFDDVAVNGFCQAGNRVLIDAKKIVEVDRNNAAQVYPGDILWQGTSATVNTFNGLVQSYDSTNRTVTIRQLDGDLDENAQLYFQNSRTTITYSNSNVVSVVDSDTADRYYAGEGVISPQLGNAYATVISTSGPNLLYLKQNYVNANVFPVGVALSVVATKYKPGDIVYQTSDGAQRYDLATFRGIVRYFHATGQGMIAIEPIQGSFTQNSSNTDPCKIWNATLPSAEALYANKVHSLTFSSGNTIQSIQNVAVNIAVSSYIHRSGVIANTYGATDFIHVNSNNGNNPSNANLIYFVSGTGVGEVKRVSGINGANLTLNSALSFSPDSTTKYSIGNHDVDTYGTVAGLFHIPSYSGFKFKTGNRLFTITDTARYNDPDYGMRASATYAASGILQTTQRIQTTPVLPPVAETEGSSLVVPASPSDRPAVGTPVKPPVSGSSASTIPRIPLGDGMAQTFFTPKPNSNKQDYGIYCTSIDLFFKSKPSVATYFKNSKTITRGSLQLPVTVKIAEVQNGYPTKNYLASKSVSTKDVHVSDIPNINDPMTATKFTFDDPVYLEPNREYAILVGSDSPDYELFIAELGTDVLGSSTTTTVRISEQPYAGSFFRSQNSSTWTPYQNQDLMFVLNKAVFDTSGVVTFALDAPPIANIDLDRVMLTSADLKFPAGLVDYSLKGVYSATLAQETNGIDLDPFKTVEFGTLSDKSSKNSINRRRLVQGNANSFILTAEMSSTDADVSPIVNIERLSLTAATFFINNAGLSNTKIAITNFGAKYICSNTTSADPLGSISVHGSTNNSVNTAAISFRNRCYPYPAYNVGLYALTISGGNGTGAAGFAVANTDGSNTISSIVLSHIGSGYTTTPTIAIQAPTFAGTTGGTTASAVASGEDGKSGGNILSKYITREIVLEDGFESGDLRVFMDAVRPTGTDILVYYKVLSGDDPERISDKSWKLMSKVKDNYSRNPNTFIGFEFRPSLDENRISYIENGISYPIGGTFKNFQIKVCLITSDESLIPRVKNLRISAIPEG